jgi:hypothetical protein
MATVLGALAAFDYWFLIGLSLGFGFCYVATRSFTLSGLLALALSPFAAVYTGRYREAIWVALAAGVTLAAHRRNLRTAITEIRTPKSASE